MNPLPQIIKSLIDKSGPITFAKFMELALYHPEYGYYTSGIARIGKKGDYYTSPCVHPAFGEILGRFISRAYEIGTEQCSVLTDFAVVEMGAGKGYLALDILDSLKRNNPELYDMLTYLIIEVGTPQHEDWKITLKEHIHKIKKLDSLYDLERESIFGVFISNELVDSFPFHRAKFKDGKLLEIFVSLRNEEFIEILDEPSSNTLKDYFDGYNLEFEDGQEVEINLHARQWLSKVSHILARGFILTIDYGYLAPELYNPSRMRGTFMCYYKHTTNENPYINLGEQDITAHVDFSNLIRVGQSLGLNIVKYTTQGQFLVDWGILDIVERYSGEEKNPDISSYRNRIAIKNLFLPEMMGDKFKVLIQEKNIRAKDKIFYPESNIRISFQKSTDVHKEHLG
ncbi:MAG TPA: SAM-dependent methyltransferase [Thermodesulfobacteriota bacterium]|nr:SAM-dependent methyltransferase [Thermodesulfobacteriota bacterium]